MKHSNDTPKQHSGWFKSQEPQGACPAADELFFFVQGGMAAERRDAVRGHLAGCVWCSEKIARLSEGDAASASETVPDALHRKTRRLWSANPLQKIWRSQILWMTLFVASLLISFGQPRYYKQFLVIALVSGIRWALSERSARHSITVTRLDTPSTSNRSSAKRDVPSR